MVRIFGCMPGRFLLLAFIGVLLTANIPASGWHQEDEQQHSRHGATAGDPRVLDDAEQCLNDTRPVEEVSCVVLYAHILDLLYSNTMNTQRPAECALDLARGYTGSPNVEPHWTFTRFSLHAMAGFVEYDEDEQTCDEPRFPHERGMIRDLLLSSEFDIQGHWYLSADRLEVSTLGIGTGPQSDTPSLGTMPCVTLRMSLGTGRGSGDGDMIAEGETTKTIVSTPYAHGHHQELPLADPCPGSSGNITAEEVTEFVVDLGPAKRPVFKHEGFTVDVQWYQHDGSSSDPAREDNINQGDWNQHTGSDYPNRIVIPVEDPIEITNLEAIQQEKGGAIHLTTQTPWGAPDVDAASIEFGLYNESGANIPLDHLNQPNHLHYCAGHLCPMVGDYPWNIADEGLEPGTYTLRATASNWQHTGHAQKEITFTVKEPEPETTTLPGPTIGIVVLIALILMRSRRVPP